MKTAKKTPAPTKSLAMKVEDSLNNEFRHLKSKLGAARHQWESERDDIQKRIYWGNYQSLLDAVTKLAKVAPKSDIEQQQALPIAQVEATWARALKEFRTTLEALPRRLVTQSIFRKCDPIEVEQVVETEVNAILARLEAGGWLKK
jgi:hypothetical protein